MTIPYSSTLFRLTYYAENELGLDENEDAEKTIRISPSAVAAIAVETMRANPYLVYCRRRGCGHRGTDHESAGCTAEGCECDGLKE